MERTLTEEPTFDPDHLSEIECPRIARNVEPMVELFEILSRSRSLEVLFAFANDAGPWRFNELKRELEIPANTLSRRLDEFEEFGLLTREYHKTVPPTVEYDATPAAIAIRPMLQYLTLWVEHDW